VTTEPKVLIVEDEPLIAMLLEDFLEDLGFASAGSIDNVADAIARVSSGGFDLAILDVNLRGEPCWPVADRLFECGIPFVVASGGNVVSPPERHASAVALSKPYTLDALRQSFDRIRSIEN
jgi:CheY-like chemotaxis protein